MTTPELILIGVLLLLGIAALPLGRFIGMLVTGSAIAGGLFYYGWSWPTALQASLAVFFCLSCVSWLGAGKLVLGGVLIIAIPALLISHFYFDVSWGRAVAISAVLLVLIPPGVVRSLVRFGLVKPPEPQRPPVPDFSNFRSSAPSYPSRSESRNR